MYKTTGYSFKNVQDYNNQSKTAETSNSNAKHEKTRKILSETIKIWQNSVVKLFVIYLHYGVLQINHK